MRGKAGRFGADIGKMGTRRTNAFHHCFLDAATCTAQEHPWGCSPQLCPALAPPWCLQKWDCSTSSPSSLPSQPPLFLIPSSSKNHNLNFPPTWIPPQWLPFLELRKVMLRFNFQRFLQKNELSKMNVGRSLNLHQERFVCEIMVQPHTGMLCM